MKSGAELAIAIVGAGMGGLAVAATLCRSGFKNVRVYEQASGFARIGAGIQMMPNSMKVLRGIGVEERLRRIAFAPYSHLNRVWDTGAVTNELPMPETLYGAPYLCMHRADLHEALASVVPPGSIQLGRKLVGLAQAAGTVTLRFADGTDASADLVIGADGVHSTVRDIILGPERPVNRGRVAYRAVFPASLHGRQGHRALANEVVGSRPPYRHLLHEGRSQRNLFRDERAGAARMDDARVMVRERRR